MIKLFYKIVSWIIWLSQKCNQFGCLDNHLFVTHNFSQLCLKILSAIFCCLKDFLPFCSSLFFHPSLSISLFAFFLSFSLSLHSISTSLSFSLFLSLSLFLLFSFSFYLTSFNIHFFASVSFFLFYYIDILHFLSIFFLIFSKPHNLPS